MEESWEEPYKKEGCVWGIEPHPMTKKILEFKKEGSVLDLGVGEGRDALFLAKNGFRVTGVDTSMAAIDRFKKLAIEHSLQVDGIVADITSFPLDKYDIVISFNTLHYLDRKGFTEVVNKMKGSVDKDGLNAIAVFIEDPDASLKFGCLLKAGELKDMYKDWVILGYKETRVKMKALKEDGTPYMHNWAVVLARKPKANA